MTLIVFKNISQFVKFWKLRVLAVLACPKSVCLSVFRLCRSAARGGQKRGPQNVGHRILLFFLNWPYSSNMRSERSSVRGGGRPPLRPPAARVQAERSCRTGLRCDRCVVYYPLLLIDPGVVEHSRLFCGTSQNAFEQELQQEQIELELELLI